MHSLNDLPTNGLYNLYANGTDVLPTNVNPCGVHSLHEFSVTGLKIMSVNFCPRDVKESTDVTSESGIPGINGIGQESYLNGMNDLNVLGAESVQEHTL